MLTMLHKHNARKRRHISRAKSYCTDWPQYEAGLKQHSNLTLCITPGAVAQWKTTARTRPGGQARYFDLTIQTCLMLRTASEVPLRQADGLCLQPDESCSFCAGPWSAGGLTIYGAGQRRKEKHGACARRDWRKCHLAVDAHNVSIVAHTPTDLRTGGPSQVKPRLSQTEGIFTQVTAYQDRPNYSIIAGHDERITVAIPPRATVVAEDITGPPHQQDWHLSMIQKKVVESCGVRETSPDGNHDDVLENLHRYPLTCPGFCRLENRGCYLCGGTEPAAVGSPAPFCT